MVKLSCSRPFWISHAGSEAEHTIPSFSILDNRLISSVWRKPHPQGHTGMFSRVGVRKELAGHPLTLDVSGQSLAVGTWAALNIREG